MLYICLSLLGFCIGSFLNVCIYRLPHGQSINQPRSHCMNCNTMLKTLDLIPILSWLILGGRCRNCGTPITFRYPAVELLTGILFIFCFNEFHLGPELFKALILTSFLIVITYIDYDHQLILDKVVIWLAGTGVVINLFTNYINVLANYAGITTFFYVEYTSMVDMLLGALIGGGLLLIIAMASRGGMGGGDIKFAAALGLWLGWQYTLMTLLLAFILGGVFGVIILALKIRGRKDVIPFGPFIAIGAWISLLYGVDLLKLYIRWFL
ncbi:type 4 prepilin-like proteins leader peptide-processing enzyme [Sporomusaceae bacterium FL31]|nr:type 4 prepilin-like proteins leader peptide-processing enzyme [Sporomusaceae bacterium FL31]GCE33441.1 type 4 prepilin-like proteins leader peptide-processing enzyme [Sporomusaceae bacterium]